MAPHRLLGLLVLSVALGCDGDRCDEDEHCLSGRCDYGECGSTIVSIIENAVEDEDEWSYDEDGEDLGPPEPPRECRAWACRNLSEEDCERSGCRLLVLGCGELSDVECALAEQPSCTPECPPRFACLGEPTICDDLDRVTCLAEPACRVPGSSYVF